MRLLKGRGEWWPQPASWAPDVHVFASVPLRGKKSLHQLKATLTPHLPHPCTLKRGGGETGKHDHPLLPHPQLQKSLWLNPQHGLLWFPRNAFLPLHPFLRGGLQSPGHTSKLERCADFPSPGFGGSGASRAPASSPCHPPQATGPWWAGKEPGDPELPAMASPIRQRGPGDQRGVQKKMRGLAKLVPCEVTEDSREGSGVMGRVRPLSRAKGTICLIVKDEAVRGVLWPP